MISQVLSNCNLSLLPCNVTLLNSVAIMKEFDFYFFSMLFVLIGFLSEKISTGQDQESWRVLIYIYIYIYNFCRCLIMLIFTKKIIAEIMFYFFFRNKHSIWSTTIFSRRMYIFLIGSDNIYDSSAWIGNIGLLILCSFLSYLSWNIYI